MDFCFTLLAIFVVVVVILLWTDHKYQKDPSGGITPNDRALLSRELSDDEELLECMHSYYELPGKSSLSKRLLVCLTHRRIILLQPSRIGLGMKTIIELRHITGYSLKGIGGITITTIDGHQHVLKCKHWNSRERFGKRLASLLDRQSSGAALSGTGVELEKLADLVNRGIISQDDFDRAKGLLLGKPASKVQESAQMLESLYALYKQGVLSESEFNLKKWDVLSK